MNSEVTRFVAGFEGELPNKLRGVDFSFLSDKHKKKLKEQILRIEECLLQDEQLDLVAGGITNSPEETKDNNCKGS